VRGGVALSLVKYRELLALHALDTSVASMVGLALAPGVDAVIGRP
jgi:hypothetical protein